MCASLLIAPLIGQIAGQAADADRSRSVDPAVIAAIKANDVMRLSAAEEIGGLAGTVEQIARELEATAAACGSTAWCLWNHLCVYHLFCGMLGGTQPDLLRSIAAAHEWVSFPAGASTGILGTSDGDTIRITGEAHFGSGARYGEWVGVPFMLEGELCFSILRSDSGGVTVDPTWESLSLRASATDTVRYEDVVIPADRIVPFPPMYREQFRDPAYPVVHHRYREDWVGLSDLWLGAMAVGVASISLTECVEGIRERLAILGTKMRDRPSIHINLGQAKARIDAARARVRESCRATDARISDGLTPTEDDYLDQNSAGMMAVLLCKEAVDLVLRVLGGNGLREGGAFERRYRDMQAMPLHINAHQDRVSEQLGRHLLGLKSTYPY